MEDNSNLLENDIHENNKPKISRALVINLAIGISLGLCLGMVLGMLLNKDSWLIWVCFGLSLGIAAGTAFGAKMSTRHAEDE